MHFTRKNWTPFFENISYGAVSRHIYISPNKVVHCRAARAYSPEFSEAWKYFESVEKGARKIVQAVSSSSKSRVRRVPSLRKRECTSRSIDPDGTSDPDRVLAARINARHTHTCVRTRVCERATASQCVHSRYRRTHARACSTRRSTTPAALSPQPIWQPPFPRCNWRTIQFPSRLPLLPACPLCYTWSPPVRSVLSPSRGSLPFAPFPPHPSDVTRSLTILCSRHWP